MDSTLNLIINMTGLAIHIGAVVLGVFAYWHLMRRRKTFMARFFWIVLFGYVLATSWQPIIIAIYAPSLMSFVIGLVFVVITSAVLATLFVNPLKQTILSYDPDEI